MSKQRKITYKCEFCGKPFDTTVYDSVNVDLDPELREKILNGSLFMHECPHCHKKNALLYLLGEQPYFCLKAFVRWYDELKPHISAMDETLYVLLSKYSFAFSSR